MKFEITPTEDLPGVWEVKIFRDNTLIYEYEAPFLTCCEVASEWFIDNIA